MHRVTLCICDIKRLGLISKLFFGSALTDPASACGQFVCPTHQCRTLDKPYYKEMQASVQVERSAVMLLNRPFSQLTSCQIIWAPPFSAWRKAGHQFERNWEQSVGIHWTNAKLTLLPLMFEVVLNVLLHLEWQMSSNGPRRITCPELSTVCVKNLHSFKFNVISAPRGSKSSVTCMMCSSSVHEKI